MSNLLPFDAYGPNGRWCEISGVVHVYFYGTDHPKEWRKHWPDRIFRRKTRVGWINRGYWHHGFLAYQWALMQFPGREMAFAGHSFGGAIAQIVTALWRHDGGKARCVTFGTIRAGRISKRLTADWVHWLHRGDVAWLWPIWPFYSLQGARSWFGVPGIPWVVHQPDHYRHALALEGFAYA